MGLTKSDKFTEVQNNRAKIFKALGHPARIAILETLMQRNVCVCGDLVEELPLSQSTISQHLVELKKVGLIEGNISGPSVCYCINDKEWNNAKNEVETLMNMYDSSVMKC